MGEKADITVDMGVFGGSTKNVHHYVRTGPLIKLSANAAKLATSISVHPIKQAIPSGSKLRFGLTNGSNDGTAGLVVVLSADAAYGDTILSVTAMAGSLQMGDVGRQCQDVTGWHFANYAYENKEAAPLLSKTPSIATASEGDVLTAYAKADLTAPYLEAGKTYSYSLNRTDVGAEDVGLAYGALALRV